MSTLRALSITPPRAWRIVHGSKDIAHRTWRSPPRLRGRCLVYVGKHPDVDVDDAWSEALIG